MITCDQHDYVEIACLFQYPVRLHMRAGEAIEGIAVNTCLNEAREECIELNQHGHHRLVALDQVASLEVRVENPHFQQVSFHKRF
ncbi:transcriptional regulator [Aliidiomarina taiwanensis]|uniref:Transcriptional regulator n=1 Tax=Aliidiomarina taiwanensis TaxID=946228 RepID=A0A432X9N8_9GAMM|nr:Rho-binding antiterminator [Aliidiomarina taiwanensis]RUO44132.1 transcriptional regulator [Aliidiomarina taiwanensis]